MTPTAALETKQCTKCGETKSLDDFYRHTAGKDGRRPECKRCTIARTSDYQREHRQEHAEYQRQRRRNNADVQGYDRRQTAAYRAAEARLRAAHRDEFDRYYAEERAKRGLS